MCLKSGEEKKPILGQEIRLTKKISNKELFLIQAFYRITCIYPKNVIHHQNFILFFVKSASYFRCKQKLKLLRQKLVSKKILIIRHETTLLKLIFGLFPDIFIDDISIKIHEQEKILLIIVKVLTYKDRMIAIGGKGTYIKMLNEIINKFFKFEFPCKKITVKCEVNLPRNIF
ncbi:MAG: hypothetical protein R6U96_12270 [Promethearchaeia archaeon]